MRRSNAPVFWLMFRAGGMLSALFGSALVFITGLAVPLGWLPADGLSYARMLGLAQHWAGKGALFVVVSLFAWHAVHRIYHSLHDIGVRTGPVTRVICYGSAMFVTVLSAVALLALGF